MKLMRIFLLLTTIIFPFFIVSCGQAWKRGPRFEEYRETIRKTYDVDLEKYRDSLSGGRADNEDLTKYDLHQLLVGIEVESEHTKNKLTALEIAADHLEEIPDYYTRLKEIRD